MKLPLKLVRPAINLISFTLCLSFKCKYQTGSDSYPLFTYTGRRDYWMCLLSLRSFLSKSNHSYTVFMIDDGTLTRIHRAIYLSVFPSAVFISKSTSDFLVSKLTAYPHLKKLYESFVLMPKLLVPNLYASNFDSFLYLDSDVLTFSVPEFIDATLSRKMSEPNNNRSSYFNKDISSSYIYSSDELKEQFAIQLGSSINAGLFIFEKSAFNADLLEQIISSEAFYDHYERRPWVTEQTLCAVLASNSKGGYEYLPPEYDIALSKDPRTAPMIHYVGAIRSQFLTQGLSFHLHSKLGMYGRY